INGNKIRPVDLTSKLLFPMWEMKEGDQDYTVMRIKISGYENKKHVCYTYNLLDKYQDETISMARTTGDTCTAVANLVIEGKYKKTGISPPEFLGDNFNEVNKYLADRNVIYDIQRQELKTTN
ncbi:MAG: saccharopine dehydrogenase, partial [Cryomorphaceae bacterium]|nr:saccharopine dehydrogenase [Cryomorphaceae bacterium]